MTNVEKLGKTLKEEFLPELETALVEMANHVQSWKSTEDDKEEFEDLKLMKNFFLNVLEDITNDKLNEEDASEILKELDEIRL